MNPPGPEGDFLIGHVRQFRSGRHNLLLTNALAYGDVVHYRFGPRRVYQLNHPDDIQYVLVKAADKFHKSPILKRITRASIGQGLLTSEGDFHKRQRKLVQPAFHHNRIARYAATMVAHTLRMLATWQDGQQRDLHHEMMKLTMEIVAKTLFDADVAGDAEALGRAITLGIETAAARTTQPLHLPDWVPTRKNNERRRAAALIEQTIMGFIEERRKSGVDKGDLLSMLLMAQDENGEGMPDRQVRDEAMTLFIAGHETTANALAWTFYLLSQQPEVEAKLLQELDQVLAGRAPSLADLPQLRYTDMIIKEAMRLYPPAWIFTREALEPLTIGPYNIAKGSILLMSPYVMHRHPAYWDEPERFLPQRFAPGWEERVPKYAYLPFGGGPRICIGNQFALMEANFILAAVMQRYHLSLLSGARVEPEPLITLRPKPGIPVVLTQREQVTASEALHDMSG